MAAPGLLLGGTRARILPLIGRVRHAETPELVLPRGHRLPVSRLHEPGNGQGRTAPAVTADGQYEAQRIRSAPARAFFQHESRPETGGVLHGILPRHRLPGRMVRTRRETAGAVARTASLRPENQRRLYMASDVGRQGRRRVLALFRRLSADARPAPRRGGRTDRRGRRQGSPVMGLPGLRFEKFHAGQHARIRPLLEQPTLRRRPVFRRAVERGRTFPSADRLRYRMERMESRGMAGHRRTRGGRHHFPEPETGRGRDLLRRRVQRGVQPRPGAAGRKKFGQLFLPTAVTKG